AAFGAGVGILRALWGVLVLEHAADQLAEGWIAELVAQARLVRGEAFEVVPRRERDRGMRGAARLHDDPAFEVGAAGAAGDLREELERALGGAEVGHVERIVGAHD